MEMTGVMLRPMISMSPQSRVARVLISPAAIIAVEFNVIKRCRAVWQSDCPPCQQNAVPGRWGQWLEVTTERWCITNTFLI